MAVQDYYFALQNLSNSDKIFGYYSGSAIFDYKFDYLTQSAAPGAGDIRLNTGKLYTSSNANEVLATQVYIDEDDISNRESVIGYLTKLDDLSDKGQIKLEVSGSSSFNLLYDIDSIDTGSSTLSYMIVNVSNGSGNVESGDSNNPISQSYAFTTSSRTTKKPIIVTFTGSELRGYHEVDVTGSSTKYIVATSGSINDPTTSGSLPAPFSIDWGVPEDTFTDPNYYPSNFGYAWLWNDGYKVKHIKINSRSATGDILTDFIKASEWVRFIMSNPINSTGSLIHPASGLYAEDYQLLNVTKYSTQGYSHLFVDQDNIDTSFAVDVSSEENITDTFTATGDYIVYASSSGTTIEPTRSISVDSSIPQGYFPSSSTSYPTEQFFRGWAGANYYVNGNLISTNGTLDDPLQSFNTGSTERDKDGAANYVPSTLPFFIDATASYIEVPSSSFVEYASQTNLTQIGPRFETSTGDEIIYYYKEDTNQIIIRGSQYLNTPKTSTPIFDPLHDVELVGPNDSPITYTTLEGFDIEVKESQSLWLTRGLANIGTQDGNLWKYNRYLHRPFKTYILTSTGSTELGYGSSEYGIDEYGSGSVPVGPPPNEFESVFIAYSSSKASDRSDDGIYTFDQNLIEPLYITASVNLDYTSIEVIRSSSYGTGSYGEDEFEYGGTGSGDDVLTWQTANLKLYQNNTVIATETTSINSSNILYGLTSTLTTTLQPYQVSIGDTLKLSLEVENEASGFNSSLVVNSYTMSFDNLVYPADGLTPVTFNNYLELNDDCDPLINNIVGDRPNQRLQDVDYSVNILDPINFDQIIKDEAVRATVPESNYTQLGFSHQRYNGSSTTREKINEYNPLSPIDSSNKIWYENNPTLSDMGKGPSLGKVPNVELKNGYIAYFNKLIDPYPTLNGKTAYYVKYLIDETGTIFDPTLSDINFSIFEKTFQLYDYDKKSTRVKTSLQSIEETKELSQLNEGLANTFKLGQYPTPILYSQTSSLGHVNSIPLSGSKFYTSLGVGATFSNFGYSASGEFTVSTAANRSSTVDFADTVANFSSGDIGLFEPTDGTGSYDGSGEFSFPLDANALIPNTVNANLCDNYQLNGTYRFYTTAIPWTARNIDRIREDNPNTKARMDLFDFTFDVYQKSPFSSTYSKSSTDFEINSLTLNIFTDADNTPSEYSVNIPIGTQRSSIGSTLGLRKTSTGVSLNLNSQWLYKEIVEQTGGTWSNSGRTGTIQELMFGGGWDGAGLQTTAVQWEWVLNFTLGGATNYFKQRSGYKFAASGNIDGKKDGGGTRFNDPYLQIGTNGKYELNGGISWLRTFFPEISGRPQAPSLELYLTSPKAGSSQNQNGATSPYWRRYGSTSNQLYMDSDILNQAYALKDENGNYNQYYVQAKLPYNGDTNTDFPLTVEPDFIEFDPVTNVWSLEEGDEIRFENDENLTFRISSIDGQKPIIPPTESPTGQLIVTVSPSFDQVEPTNFDFFVVRRYKENKNFIILDQQKPYGFPVSASSSPGILLPEHRIEKYDRNPDEVLKDLIEKRII